MTQMTNEAHAQGSIGCHITIGDITMTNSYLCNLNFINNCSADADASV